jgi:hypothetical protein
MSYALYNDLSGLRFWRQRELRMRERLTLAIVECVQNTLLDINQMWAFEEVEAPPMMPLARMSAAYDRSDVFVLLDPPGGQEPFAMRAETTDGTYATAEAIMRTTNRKPPLGFYKWDHPSVGRRAMARPPRSCDLTHSLNSSFS